MKWFMHQTSLRKDPKIKLASAKLGSKKDAYFYYVLLLEICTEMMQKGGEPKFVFYEQELAHELGTKHKHLRNILGTFSEHSLFVYRMIEESNGNIIEIFWPKIKEILDNATRKVRTKYERSTEQELELDVDVDIKKEIDKENILDDPTDVKKCDVLLSDSTESSPSAKASGYPLLLIWNENRGTLKEGLSLNPKRKKSISTRLKEVPDLERWAAAARRAATSPFCCGKNDRNWVANFDWFIRPDTLTKIEEGQYDNKSTNTVKILTGNMYK